MASELCSCGDGWFDPDHYTSCYDCYTERRSEYVDCIFCGRWHTPKYATCFRCRESDPEREEAGRFLRWLILGRDQYTCWDCGYTGPEVEVDHVKPCASGGNARPWNLQALCRDCNQAKGDTWWTGSRWDLRRGELLRAYFTTLRSYLTDEEKAALAEEVWEWRTEHSGDPEWPRSLPTRSMAENRMENSPPTQTADGDALDATQQRKSSTASHQTADASTVPLFAEVTL